MLLNEDENRSLDKAVHKLLNMMDESIKAFDEAASTLDAKTKSDKALNQALWACIDSRREFVTGLIEWTLVSARYRMDKFMQEDGSVIIPLS